MIESRGNLRLREYGRNVQNIVSYIKTKDSKEERTRSNTVLKRLKAGVQLTPEYGVQ